MGRARGSAATTRSSTRSCSPIRGRPVGVASYLRIDPAMGSIEVGHLSYSPALQRSAVATEAMYLMMRRAFDELGYRRYEWKCDSLNAPSRRAAERLGFRYEGTFRQMMVIKQRSRDTAWYSILDSEWPALRTAFERWLDPANFDASGAQRARLEELRRGGDALAAAFPPYADRTSERSAGRNDRAGARPRQLGMRSYAARHRPVGRETRRPRDTSSARER